MPSGRRSRIPRSSSKQPSSSTTLRTSGSRRRRRTSRTTRSASRWRAQPQGGAGGPQHVARGGLQERPARPDHRRARRRLDLDLIDQVEFIRRANEHNASTLTKVKTYRGGVRPPPASPRRGAHAPRRRGGRAAGPREQRPLHALRAAELVLEPQGRHPAPHRGAPGRPSSAPRRPAPWPRAPPSRTRPPRRPLSPARPAWAARPRRTRPVRARRSPSRPTPRRRPAAPARPLGRHAVPRRAVRLGRRLAVRLRLLRARDVRLRAGRHLAAATTPASLLGHGLARLVDDWPPATSSSATRRPRRHLHRRRGRWCTRRTPAMSCASHRCRARSTPPSASRVERHLGRRRR